MADAFVLAGAASQGAFTAGACLELLATPTRDLLHVDARRIVSASSGALNGAFVASRLRANSDDMQLLEELWLEKGDFFGIFDPSLAALLRGRGISTGHKILALLQRYIPPGGGSHPIELAVVVTNLDGDVDRAGCERVTTFERCFRFNGDAFDTPEGRSQLFDAVVASTAFPILFEPVEVTVGGQTVRCIDGGATNNAPIRYALEGLPEVDRLFVIAPYPAVRGSRHQHGGLAYVAQLADILVRERHFRDLRRTTALNRALIALEADIPTASVRARVLDAFGLSGRRVVNIVEIRPTETLEGNIFSGLFSRRIRRDYLRAGRDAVRRAVDSVRDR